ncbi:ISAs1 family transposase [Streptomyces sp. HUAS TT3]|uniref:ISAs1 family transposase n=1 Tax=Streptomyces sp. HUAS TT3 TaxID=3447510 RepID=UPI003F65BA36
MGPPRSPAHPRPARHPRPRTARGPHSHPAAGPDQDQRGHRLRPPARADRERGHGRRETRSTRVLTVTDLHLDFPHAVQAAKILRHRTDVRTGKVTRQTVYVITDLTAQQASPQGVAHLARSQWTTENRLHFVRDTTFAEDASKIRTGHGPENMATLRNLAIDTLRRAGNRSIAAGLHEVSYAPHTRPLNLLRLP